MSIINNLFKAGYNRLRNMGKGEFMVFPVGQGLNEEEKLRANLAIQTRVSEQAADDERKLAKLSDRISSVQTITSYAKEFSAIPAVVRTGISLGQDVYKGITGKDVEPYRPESEVGRFFLEFPGEDRGVRPFSERMVEAYDSSFGRRVADKAGIAEPFQGLASGVGFAFLGGIEAIPGTPKAKAFSTISKLDDVGDITRELRTFLKGSDEELESIASQLVKVDKPKEVEKIVLNAQKPKPRLLTVQEIQELQRDNLVTSLKKMDSQSFVKGGKADIDSFAEKDAILQKIEEGSDTQDDFLRGMEIYAQYGGKPARMQVQNVFGAVGGIEVDDEGNIDFDPKKAAFGVAGLSLARGVKPSVIEKSDETIKILNDALKKSKPLRKEQEALYSAERAKRAARVSSVGEKVGGEKGFRAQLSQLKGQLPRVEFESIRKKIDQSSIDSLFDRIEQTETLLPFERITAKSGLAKILGEQGGSVPTKNEIELLREVFPDDFIQSILEKRPFRERLMEYVGEVLNVPRAMMATLDLSAPFRQGIFLVGRPKQFLPAFKDMFRYAFSEKSYQGLIDGIKKRSTYKQMKEAKLALTDIGSTKLSLREESFMSSLPEKIPGIGPIVRGSNRAYTGFLNKLRADVFDDLIKKSRDLKIEQTDKLLRDTARFVNSATGRGELGSLNAAAVTLNSVFFSPRLIASRVNLLNPLFYTSLSPSVRKEALKSLLTFGSITGSVIGLASLGGADVETDPRSADFAKIKVGNTRYDTLGGFQQYIRLVSQLISGKIVSSTTGREITLGEGYKPLTRKDILQRFFENKTSPVASFAIGLSTGQTTIGQDFNVPTEIFNRFTPMVIQDMYDLYQEKELEGLVWWLPAPFGVGTQTYGKQELVEGVNPIGQPTTQVRPVPGIGEKISESIFGKQPLEGSRSYNVEVFYDQLLALPRQEASDIFEKIAESNPELAKQITDIVKNRERGITAHDKDLKSKGVRSGDRAKAIKKDLDKLKTKEEKFQLWDEYSEKGIITKDISEQLMILLNQ